MQIVDIIEYRDYNDKAVQVPVYGDHNQPAFLVHDVVCGLLGLTQISDDAFFREHTADDRYVLQRDLYLSRDLNNVYFFTEIGLYKCLFRSNHKNADAFQEKVALLLKDLRLKNIQHQQSRFADIVTERDNLLAALMNIQQKMQEYATSISSLNSILESAYQNVVIYRITIIEEQMIYVGKSTDIITREQTHKTRSSNQMIRAAVQQGNTIRTDILAEVKCLTVDQSKYLERQHILAVPASKRVNSQIPELLDDRHIPQDFKDLVNESVRNPLCIPIDQWRVQVALRDNNESTQQETREDAPDMYLNVQAADHIDYINSKVDHKFKAHVDEIHTFYNRYQFYPRDSPNVSDDEKRMARLCVKIRTQHCNQGVGENRHYQLSVERYAYIIHKMPTFFTAYDQEANFRQKIDRVLQSYQSHSNKLPSAVSDDDEEVKLNEFINKIRTAFNKQKPSTDRENYCRSKLPFGFFSDEILLNDAKFKALLNDLKQWTGSHNDQLPSQIQNKKLANFVKTLQLMIKDPNIQSFKLDTARLQFIKDNFQSLATLLQI